MPIHIPIAALLRGASSHAAKAAAGNYAYVTAATPPFPFPVRFRFHASPHSKNVDALSAN